MANVTEVIDIEERFWIVFGIMLTTSTIVTVVAFFFLVTIGSQYRGHRTHKPHLHDDDFTTADLGDAFIDAIIVGAFWPIFLGYGIRLWIEQLRPKVNSQEER